MTWTPDAHALSQVLQLIRESQQANHDNARHKAVLEKLDQLKQTPEFGQYLMYVLTQAINESDHVRMMSGLLLKNMVRENYEQLPPSSKQYIQQCCLDYLSDPNPHVQSAIGNITSTITTVGQLSSWFARDPHTHRIHDSLIHRLLQLMDVDDLTVLKSVFSTLQKICEDAPHQLTDDKYGCPAGKLLPRLISFISHPSEDIRTQALACINPFLITSYIVHENFFEPFLHQLYGRLQDTSKAVRIHVCQAFVYLLETNAEDLLPHSPPILLYCLHCLQDSDDRVALQAAEFWLAFSQIPYATEPLTARLPELIPILLQRMIYDEHTQQQLEAQEEEDNAHIADKDQDIKPRFHKSKRLSCKNPDPSHEHEKYHHHCKDEHEEDEEEEEENEDEEEEEEEEWTVRRCCATTLDQLASLYQASLAPLLLQSLSTTAFQPSSPWFVIEAGLLALGAVAEGCATAMPVDAFVDALLQMTSHAVAAVRATALWTLSRYSDRASLHANYWPCLIARMRDHNKKVQCAACSALSVTLEQMDKSKENTTVMQQRDALLHHLPTLVSSLHACLLHYQQKNQYTLYDLIASLATAFASSSTTKQQLLRLLESQVLPILIERYQHENARELFPVMEALSAVLSNLAWHGGPLLLPKALHMLSTMLSLPEEAENYDDDVVTVTLDLIDAMLESGHHAQLDLSSLLQHLLLPCLRRQHYEVRQSAYALIGDLVKSGYDQRLLLPILDGVLGSMTWQVKPYEEINVTNNAVWCLGEMMMAVSEETVLVHAEQKYQLSQRMVHLLSQASGSSALLKENLAITVGRMAWRWPARMAGHLAFVLPQWSDALRASVDNAEKESAIRGVLSALPMSDAMHGMQKLMTTLALCQQPSSTLQKAIAQFLAGFREKFPAEWQKLQPLLKPDIVHRLSIYSTVA